ncbi:hypothetical protein ACFUC1_01290 [Pedococcus sp. NPDC057267]|uniref:hypothetical protein n=1 Tax=Pedococcus sp. NPDC057267 TaxID=3346077 RepID=UPI00362EB5EB
MSVIHELREHVHPEDTRRLLLLVAAAALVPWTAYLGVSLPTRYTVSTWSLAWVGFDVLVAALLAVTAWLGLRRRPEFVLAAVAAAGMLGADAWFDVATANTGDRLGSVLSAVLVELPLAVALVVTAGRRVRELARPATHPA